MDAPSDVKLKFQEFLVYYNRISTMQANLNFLESYRPRITYCCKIDDAISLRNELKLVKASLMAVAKNDTDKLFVESQYSQMLFLLLSNVMRCNNNINKQENSDKQNQ